MTPDDEIMMLRAENKSLREELENTRIKVGVLEQTLQVSTQTVDRILVRWRDALTLVGLNDKDIVLLSATLDATTGALEYQNKRIAEMEKQINEARRQ